MYSAVNFVQMLLHFNCTYKMDPMAEATTVIKDKIYFFFVIVTQQLWFSLK